MNTELIILIIALIIVFGGAAFTGGVTVRIFSPVDQELIIEDPRVDRLYNESYE